MRIHHLRNATFVIESGTYFILVDPMLSKEKALPPFSKKRHKAERNPTVPMPDNAQEILDKVTHCLITHSQKLGIKALQHTDHLDGPGENFLRSRNIPVICRRQDAPYLIKLGINVETTLRYWKADKLLGGKITSVPAQHGHGWVKKLMANGAGFHLQLPNEPSIYISGDTVFSKDVERALTELKPDIAVMASGSASLDFGSHILMTMEELIAFTKTAPGKVIANHLESLNHCPTTRTHLKDVLKYNNLLSKTYIPEDGESLNFQ